MASKPGSTLRPISCEQAVITQPDGSATFYLGNTQSMAAVYGPVEARSAKELVDRASLEVVYKPKVGVPGCSARAVENMIGCACETALLLKDHPRTTFVIVIQELHDDGGILACSLNAVCCALLDACAPMRYPFAAVACAVDEDGQIVIDPNAACCRSATAVVTFVFDGIEQNVLATSSTGQLSDTLFQTCLVACRQASRKVFETYRDMYTKLLPRAM